MPLVDTLDDFFELDDHDTDIRTEGLAGLTTFLTMSYIVLANPAILAQQTGPDGAIQAPGIALAGLGTAQVEQMLAVVTILATVLATLVMALYANRPFGAAPGMGLNAFFAFTVVGAMGIPWQTALAAVFLEGIIFVGLTAAGARRFIIELFPKPVKFAVGSGIGLFLAFIGLQEMHLVVDDPATLVTLGPVAADPVATLSVIGLLITLGLYAYGLKASLVIGIVATTGLGWLAAWMGFGTETAELVPAVPQPHYDITPLVGACLQGFSDLDGLTFAFVVFAFFFVDFFDTAGTLTGVAQAGDFLDEDGNLPEAEKPLMADALGTTFGAFIGTSTVTAYIESATGVEIGGRTGLTALIVALLFCAALVFVPLAAAIPLYASHIALVVVAVLMLREITAVEWERAAHAIPAGLTIFVMPLTFSIANGLAAGIVSYPVVKVAAGEGDEVAVGQWLLAATVAAFIALRTSGFIGG